MKWQKLANGKWRPIREPHDKMDKRDPEFERKRIIRLSKVFLYCDSCHEKYNLANPCIHHLTASPEHVERYKKYKAKLKNKKEVKTDEKQKRL